MSEKSSIGLIRRFDVNPEKQYGMYEVPSVPADAPALVAVGGELANRARRANFYASMLLRFLDYYNLAKVGVYSAYYSFEGQPPNITRRELFRRAGRRMRDGMNEFWFDAILKTARSYEADPVYIQQLFDATIGPRIFNADGTPRPAAAATSDVRKLKFFTHCHGAAVVCAMGEIMHKQMLSAGYKKADIQKIQKEILVINFAPLAPLEKSHFTTISFASSDDDMMRHHNNDFSEYMLENSDFMQPVFFEGKLGNIFVAPELHVKPDTDHSLADLLAVEVPESLELAENGVVIYSAMRNALRRGAQHSLSGGRLPDIKALTDGDGVDFERLRAVGNGIYNFMLKDIRAKHSAMRKEKQK